MKAALLVDTPVTYQSAPRCPTHATNATKDASTSLTVAGLDVCRSAQRHLTAAEILTSPFGASSSSRSFSVSNGVGSYWAPWV